MSFGEAFLHHPGRLPLRRDGEIWGRGELWLDLPGGPYSFSGASAEQREVFHERYGECCHDSPAHPAGGAIETRLLRCARHEFRELDLRGWTCTLDLAPLATTVSIAGLGFLAQLEWDPVLAGTIWTPVARGPELEGVIENFLRVLLAYRMLECRGVLLHSAGLVGEGSARLFFGPSGSGKSTLSRIALAGGRKVLSDDLNAVWMTDDGALVRAVPLTGELAPSGADGACYPLRGFYRLRKGREVAVATTHQAIALASLFSSSPFVNVDPYRRSRLERNLESILSSSRGYSFTFPKRAEIEEILLCLERAE